MVLASLVIAGLAWGGAALAVAAPADLEVQVMLPPSDPFTDESNAALMDCLISQKFGGDETKCYRIANAQLEQQLERVYALAKQSCDGDSCVAQLESLQQCFNEYREQSMTITPELYEAQVDLVQQKILNKVLREHIELLSRAAKNAK